MVYADAESLLKERNRTINTTNKIKFEPFSYLIDVIMSEDPE